MYSQSLAQNKSREYVSVRDNEQIVLFFVIVIRLKVEIKPTVWCMKVAPHEQSDL